MEINTPSKHLGKHTLPIIMVATALLALQAAVFDSPDSLSTETALARGLVTRVFLIRPSPNGLAKAKDYNPAANQPDYRAGSSLSDGLPRTGLAAQLSISLQP